MDNEGGGKSGFFAKIKKIKHIEIIVAVVAVVIMLGIYFVGFGGTSNKEESTSEIYSDYCAKIQSELCDYVSKIQSAGSAQVVINWESSVELLIAYAESSSMGSTTSNTSTPTIISISGSSQPIVLKEIYPKPIGVVVVCEGGGDAKVKVDVLLSVATLLDISTDKIVVLPMSKKK